MTPDVTKLEAFTTPLKITYMFVKYKLAGFLGVFFFPFGVKVQFVMEITSETESSRLNM